MYHKFRLVAFVAIAALAACASLKPTPPPPPPAQVRCNETPQWTSKDAAGHDVGIFICFGEKSQLLYSVHVLPPAPVAAPAPTPAAADGLQWDRPECDYYRPEAQKLFCHRVKATKAAVKKKPASDESNDTDWSPK